MPVLPADAASARAEQGHSGPEQPFVNLKREMNLSIFGFSFTPRGFGLMALEIWLPMVDSPQSQNQWTLECGEVDHPVLLFSLHTPQILFLPH